MCEVKGKIEMSRNLLSGKQINVLGRLSVAQGMLLTVSLAFTLIGCGGGGGSSNQAPVSDAGTDQTVDQATLVTLDGSLTADPDTNDALTYQWSVVSKPASATVVLAGDTTLTPTFTPWAEGSYILELVTSDGSLQNADQVEITSQFSASYTNEAPVSDAGALQKVDRGTLVTLDGSLTADPDIGDTLTYQWAIVSQPASATVNLSGDTTLAPTFTPDVDGSYILELVTSDGSLEHADQVEVTSVLSVTGSNLTRVDIPDTDLVTGASSSITITDGPVSIGFVSVYVNITHTSAENLVLVLEAPDGTEVGLSAQLGKEFQSNYTNTVFNDNSPNDLVGVLAPFTGVYQPQESFVPFTGMNSNASGGVWTLHVYDAVDPLEVGTLDNWVLVLSSDTETNLPPLANAGAEQYVENTDLVTLDGSASWDPDTADTLSYQWALIDSPIGSVASLTNENTISPTFTADEVGDYVVQLTVNDGAAQSVVVDEVIVSAAQIIFENTTSLVITDYDGVTVVDNTSPIVVTGGPAALSRVAVKVNIAHTFATDVNIWLESPAGTMVDLSIASGNPDFEGSFIIEDSPLDDDYINTVFDDNASMSIEFAIQPFTGVFRPEQPLSAFNGESADGTWILHVSDDIEFDEGTLTDWSLILY